MYNPYAGQASNNGGNPYWDGQQQQSQHHQQGNFGGNSQPPLNPNNSTNNNTNSFNVNQVFGDPAAQMGLQFGQSAFNASQAYMKENIQQFVGGNDDLKYYFKVSNSYVLKKLGLILFPYKNSTWIRQIKPSSNGSAEGDEFATPFEDVNAPDLYIPSMSLMTYIVFWALFEGLSGDFHPEMLGYATTRTLAFYLIDVAFAKVAFYVLGTSTKSSKIWDLAAYGGYKFVPILAIIIIESLTNSIIVKYIAFFALVFSLGFFLMRSLRYAVLPTGLNDNLSTASKRIRTQFLFVYCFVIQGLFVWLLT